MCYTGIVFAAEAMYLLQPVVANLLAVALMMENCVSANLLAVALMMES